MMRLRSMVRLLLLGVLAVAALTGNALRTQTAQASPSTVMSISRTLCYVMNLGKDWNDNGVIDSGDDPTGVVTCFDLDQSLYLQNLVRVLGGDPSNPKPADFAAIDLDANQLHEHDGISTIIAFVSNDAQATFMTSNGVFQESGTSSVVCGAGQSFQDEDCDGDGVRGDGVVAVNLEANNAPRGPGTVTVSQGGTNTTLNFTITGEPSQISFSFTKPAVQAGASSCPYPQTNTAWGQVPANPQETVMTAQIVDSDGTPLTASLLKWQIDDPTKAVAAASFGWTTDLGSSGLIAKNVLCGTADAGSVTVTASITNGSDVLPMSLVLDPWAGNASVSHSETVLLPAVGGVAEPPDSIPSGSHSRMASLMPVAATGLVALFFSLAAGSWYVSRRLRGE